MPDRTCCEGCCVRHECPGRENPTGLDETWTCPECGKPWFAFNVSQSFLERGQRAPLGVTPETLGWTTAIPQDPDDRKAEETP